jgi:4-hydroxythreonine-4-phosphate dehydrogenase
MSFKKPILAITMGDPAGIGPEIAVKVFSAKEVYNICSPLLVGNSMVIREIMKITGSSLTIRKVTRVEEAGFQPGMVDLIEIGTDHPGSFRFGEVSAPAGNLAFRIILKAIEMARSGEVHGVVTGPIHKEAIIKAGHLFSGHTEIFAHYTGAKKVAMLLADDFLKVIHVTTHVSLRKACDLVKKERIREVITLMDVGLKKLGYPAPRIGVAGLNPHSGDNGLFGTEELEEIVPAIREACLSGIRAEGPVPPDTLFAMARGGRFDGCVAMYHDQGHIPFKYSGFEWDENNQRMKSVKGVNISLGLPVIRTSVDHGTAFEIAGKGIASPDALMNAILYAVKLANV